MWLLVSPGGIEIVNKFIAFFWIECRAEQLFCVEVHNGISRRNSGGGEIFLRIPAGIKIHVLASRIRIARFFPHRRQFSSSKIRRQVVAGEKSARIDPRAAAVPSFDGRGIEQFLSHDFERAVHLSRLTETHIECAEASDDELHGTLDLPFHDFRRVEPVARKKHAEHRMNLVFVLSHDGRELRDDARGSGHPYRRI